MVRPTKKYFAKTEEDFIGMVIESNSDTTYTILPWEGDKTLKGNTKLYKVYCEVCNNNPLFKGKRFLIRKGDALFGYCPCACSSSYKMTEFEFESTCKTLCKSLGKIYKGLYKAEKNKTKSKLSIYCPQHNVVNSDMNLQTLRKTKHGCKLCANEAIKRSKLKTVKDFLQTFNLPNTVQVFKDNTYKDKQGQYLYWNLICNKCSYDKYVKAGICTGVFRTTRGQLQNGALPCRCNPTYSISKSRASFDIQEICEENGYKFLGFKNKGTTYSRVPFFYTCSVGHERESDHHKMVTCGYGCGKCSEGGVSYYPEQTEREDYLYFICLWDGKCDIFLKVGRSFHWRARYNEYKNAGFIIKEVLVLKGTHAVVWGLEQDCHKFAKEEHYMPSAKFGGSVLECFGTELGYSMESYIKSRNKELKLEIVYDKESLNESN